MTQLILFNIANGLIIGAFYALMAIGLSLIMSLSDVINFAHGGFLAIGAYIAYTLSPYIGFWGGLLVAPVLTAVLGIIVEKFLISRVYGRDPLYSLLLTFGLAFIFEDGTRMIWGAQSLPYSVPNWLDLETVSVLGVNVRVLRNLNFGIGIYLAGLAGVLAAGQLGLQPTIGAALIMPSFVVIIIGGLGSLLGTLLGGLLIGVASGITSVFLPSGTEAVMYVMMALVLLVRPQGLLGEEGRF
jgi:branched-chain amino acid transport system permease protein